MSTNIFQNEHSESAVQVIRSTMSVSVDDDGQSIVSFAMNRGKGSGAQSMPVDEFRDYVAALSDVAENGIPEQDEEQLSAAESLRRTIRNKDGVISFRVRSGKGAKPAKVNASDLSEVASLLASTVDAVEAAGKSLSEEG